MHANEGDQLRAGSGGTAMILQVLGQDGQPPYVVRWDQTGHIAMTVPDQYSRVVAKAEPQPDGHVCTGRSVAASSR